MRTSSLFDWHPRVVAGVAIALALATACASGVLTDPSAGFSTEADAGAQRTDADGSGDSPLSTGGEDSGVVGFDGGGTPEGADTGSAGADASGPGDDSGNTDVRSGNGDGGGADRESLDSAPLQDGAVADGPGRDASDPCAPYSASCADCTPNRGGAGCGWCSGGCHQGTSGGPSSAGVCGATPWIWKSSSCP